VTVNCIIIIPSVEVETLRSGCACGLTAGLSLNPPAVSYCILRSSFILIHFGQFDNNDIE
jgi:hypothetical protein